ncbi:MAG: DUF192 domain-containing protein [Gammaproteobacteria bacterium]
MISGLLLIGAGCSASTPPEDLSEPLLKDFGRSTLKIASGQAVHTFSIYVADSPSERRQGLMFVEDMPDDVGMLFFYDTPARASMWMKNTVMSLDMLFIKSNGTVESIAAATTPGSLKSVAAQGKVCCVLELKAGISETLGISPGDQLIHAHFNNVDLAQ